MRAALNDNGRKTMITHNDFIFSITVDWLLLIPIVLIIGFVIYLAVRKNK